jgi:O-antigen ligase
MHWLLIGYMFLFIDRPFEVWPWLGDLHVERLYMLVTLAAWCVYPNKKLVPSPLHAAFAAFAAAVLVCWASSPWSAETQDRVEDWFKVVVFYVLVVTTVHDERGLQRMAVGFVAVMGLYLLHSFREFLLGRHTFRMGIARMIGVDGTLGDPNSFGASIVVALPFAVALWRTGIGGRLAKGALTGYLGLSVLCVLLTGSRSSLLGLLVYAGWLILRSGKRWAWLTAFALAAPAAFVALPGSLQERFETIIDSDVGPANAKESGEGRIVGLMTGIDLFGQYPLTGVGPGAWRPATKSKVESHNLYGQLLGETGLLGAVTFAAVLLTFFVSLRRVKALRDPESATDLVYQVPIAVGAGVLLMLFLGNFGHNLFRFNWLWYGGFLAVATDCARKRPVDSDDVLYSVESYTVSWSEPDPAEV